MTFKIINLITLIVSGILISNPILSGQQQTKNSQFKTGLVNDLDNLDIETGDLVLFQSKTFNGIVTQIGTLSPYTHCAIVIKNPDGSIWITHSTDNDYNGNRIPIIHESGGRPGIILTKLEDMFLSINGAKSGFYHHIWIRKFDESWAERPKREDILEYYENHKSFPFTKSALRFTLSAFDLKLFGYDLLSLPDDETYFCSEYVHKLLKELGYPIDKKQKDNEYTPKDIRNLEPYYDMKPVVFQFKDGMYMVK